MLQYHTVEYDGYTYKKEEKAEEEKIPGAHYLFSTLSLTPEKRAELQRIITRMSTKSKWKDLSDKQERVYSKMEKILSKLKAYTPFSVPFLNKVSKREAPEYYNLISTPMDLGKIGKKLFLQEYTDVNEFMRDLDLIWENCFRFNNTHGNIYAMYAQKMKEKSLVLLQDLFSERDIEIEEQPEEVEHFLCSEKHRKEMAATRAAILQNPSEFTYRRTGQKMGEYWKQEIRAIKEIEIFNPLQQKKAPQKKENTAFLYIPEYTHFYNSFPTQIPESMSDAYSEYSIDTLHLPELATPSRIIRAQPAEKAGQQLVYADQVYRAEGKIVDTIAMGRPEIVQILKKIVTKELLSVGFTSTEASALNVLVSHVLYKTEGAVRKIADCTRRASRETPEDRRAAVIKEMAQTFGLETAEVVPPVFFSEEEEESGEESIIDMIYSNAEDADVDIEEDLV